MDKNSTFKSGPKVQTGFVGFFDILGYKAIMQSGISKNTLDVVEILDGLEKRSKQAVRTHLGITDESKEAAKKWNAEGFSRLDAQVERINLRVVSDSILLWFGYDEESSQIEKPSLASMLLLTAAALQRAMMEEGLPLRGSIAFGEFIFTPNVFVGLPIIQAYELGQSLDLAACAIHESAENEFKTLRTINNNLDDFLGEGFLLLRYRTPVKAEKQEMNLLCLNPAWPTLDGYKPLKERRNDLRAYVIEQFSMHKKTLSSEALSKVEKTTGFFQWVERLHPQLFDREP